VKPGNGDGAKGARLRLSGGGNSPGLPTMLGDSPWKPVTFDFTVTDADPVLIAELPPGVAGEVWIDRSSVTLSRLP